MDFKAVCTRLSAIRDAGYGDFYTTDETGRTSGWRFLDGKLAAYSSDRGSWQGTAPDPGAKENEILTTVNNRAYKWKFVDGKLSEVSITPDWKAIYRVYSEEGIARHPEVVPAFQKEIELLTQTYGKPSKVVTIPYGNAYGAHWDRSEFLWNTPDGTQIVAFERTEFNHQGQLELVSFHSEESLEKTQQAQPNPYK